MSYGNTGFVWKNDVYARGSHVNREGMVASPKRCMVCSGNIEATETCIYVFSARGTSAAQSRYVHAACEPQCHIEPINRERSICRVCQKSGNLDGCFKIPGRNLYYHQSCLPNAPQEVTPEEEVRVKMKKRAEGRLKRGEVYYEVKINPYAGLELFRVDHHISGPNKVIIVLKPLDGRLVRVSYDWSTRLFVKGCWVPESKLREFMEEEEEKKDVVETLLKLQTDLKKYFDARGRVIGERLDCDYKLRFVLNYGTSLDGAVNEPIR